VLAAVNEIAAVFIKGAKSGMVKQI
jgi:hypothetical protein